MILLQTRVPESLSPPRGRVLPAIEAGILVVLVASDPRQVNQSTRRLRRLSLLLIVLASLANFWAAASLVVGLVHGTEGKDAAGLLAHRGEHLDDERDRLRRSGTGSWTAAARRPRAAGADRPGFPVPADGRPDLGRRTGSRNSPTTCTSSFTNATAFSPTDTMPLSRWAKLAMMLQAAVSLVTAALVIARAVNILR